METLFMSVCLGSQLSCHASLKFAGYSNLLNAGIFKMLNLKLSQPSVFGNIIFMGVGLPDFREGQVEKQRQNWKMLNFPGL